GLYFPCSNLPIAEDKETEIIAEAISQVNEYFSGKRKKFELPLTCKGTEFQELVWSALSEIPYGETVTYGELAAKLGNPKSSRAVGTACAKNPLPIIVPCHRVVQSSGGIGSYAGGKKLKEDLLNLEVEFL
ncbi:MAG TPA: methylated-DNA--[protein]-cysteine S-methyltransferase, partial [Candidatus Methanomethylophilaceae archaeon]|nr:methylated-DNA--[protein]-cysteine S-methyltransferase [Candidatus Methanomethylophilaceae archaeon]